MVEVGDFQIEVELGRPRIVGQKLDGHARQLTALLELPALHIAHHLKQRVIRRTARRLQRVDQMVKRQVLMGLALDHGIAHLLEQVGNSHLPVQLTAQHLGVEEGTDQPFAFRANAVSHGGTDAQIVLTAVAMQQHRQCRGHGHKQGQAVLGIERPHARCQVIAEVETVQFTLVALHRRPGSVGGQLQ